MTFTYSGDPASSTVDAVRFYVQDTDVEDPLVSDEEITFLIDAWASVTDSPVFIASVACDAIVAKFARELSYSADGVSVSASELQTKYIQLSEHLRSQFKASQIGGGPDVGGIMIGDVIDEDIAPLTWGKGMHDNIRAGQQDFGGTEPYHYTYPEKDGTYP